jgi:glycosyltransferase involved in cell wall biosynthesis
MRPLTGGCHFSSGCSGFEAECRNCPQLLDNLDDLTAKNKTLLATAMQHTGIHLVAPSSWMFEQAKRATSRGENPLSIIPYGVDSFHFTPGDQLTSRERLGLAPRILYLLLAAQHHGEKRKGFGEALGILEKIKERDDLKQMISNGTLRVLLCGYHAEEVTVPGYQVDRVGHLDHESMPDIYRAADILLFTSLEDNLPNVVMEGLACGLPVVGHDLGGVRDLIGRESGAECLFQIGDADQAVTLLHTLLLEKKKRAEMGRSAALRMKTHFSLNKQTEAYLELYRSLLGNPLCDGKSKGVSREEEYRNLVGAVSKKIETLEKHHLSLTHKLESHQILGGSKWVRLGQVLKLCHRP